MRLARDGWFVLFFALTVGCSPEDRDEAGRTPVMVEDSAGVVIVHNSDSSWSSDSAWRISPEPTLTIGDVSGREGTDFGTIGGALRLSDGRIVVPDGMSQELRFFGPAGEFLLAAGGAGDGPGEFRRLDSRLGLLRNDSIAARDVGAYRSAIFTSDGTVARTIPGPPLMWNGLSAVFVAGWLEDGSFITGTTPQPAALPPGRSVAEQEWHYFDPEGVHVGAIATLPAYHANNEGDGRGPLALGPRAQVAIAPHGLWYGFPETFELRYYTPNGLERIVRRAWRREPLPAEVRESYRRRQAEIAEECIARIPAEAPPTSQQTFLQMCQGRLEQLTFTDALPAFTRILVSRDGFVWVQEHRSASALSGYEGTWSTAELSSPRWSVFDPDGRWLGTVQAPAEVRLLEVGPDYVLGTRLDEFDVPYLVVHELDGPEMR